MLRRVFAALALLAPTSLMAQADKDAIVITGVVDGAGGGGGFQVQDQPTWTSSVHLVAWRESGPQGEGPVRTEQLRIEIPDQRQDQLEKWGTIFPARGLVRFTIRAPVRHVNGRAFAELRAPMTRAEDAELLAAADSILNPPPFVDPQFGTFTSSDRTFPDWFTQKREWLGRDVEVKLTLDYAGIPSPDSPQQALATMRAVWDKREKWDARIREEMAEQYYQIWLDNWRGENERVISREAFKARFVLDDLSFAPDGSFSIIYLDDALFWGHRMVVDYLPETDELAVSMFG